MAEEFGDIDVLGILNVKGGTTVSTINITSNPFVKSDASVNPTNLLSNGNFENHSAGTTAVPDGFALEGTPTLATDTGDIGYGAISQKITATGAGLEGIKYTLSGLRASTTYSVSWRTKVTAGDTSQVLTTGAGTDLTATESTSTTFETKTGTFITDASGTAVVLKFMAKSDGDIVWFDGVQVNQGESAFAFSDKPIPGVWNTYTPTVSASAGTITSYTASGRFSKIGKTVNFTVNVAITNNGNGSGGVIIGLPVQVANQSLNYFAMGREYGTTGKTLEGLIAANQTATSVYYYDNTYPGGSGSNIIQLSGTYESL
jgi:hypothetical protein